MNWYLKDIKTVQELTNKKLFVEKVIDRLVHHVSYCHVTDVHIYTIVQDHVLLPLVMEEIKEGSEDNSYQVVHPNYVIES